MLIQPSNHHHHMPPPSDRLHRTAAGGGNDRTQPVAHLRPNIIARLMGIDAAAVRTPAAARKPVAGIVQFQAQRRQTNKCGRSDDDSARYSGSISWLCLNRMTMRVPGTGWRPRRCWRRRRHRHPREDEEELQLFHKMRQQDLQALLRTSSSSCPRPSGSDSDSGARSRSPVLREEDLRKQKMARYGFGLGRSKVTQDELPLVKDKDKNKNGAAVLAWPSSSPRAAAAAAASAEEGSRDLQEASAARESPSYQQPIIVLLKPTTACSASDARAVCGARKTLLLGLPKLHGDANASIRMLLQEVKDRVQRELTAATATATGGGAPTSSAWPVPVPPPLQLVTEETREMPVCAAPSPSHEAFSDTYGNRTDTTAVEAAWSRDSRACITELLIAAAGLYDDDSSDSDASACMVDSNGLQVQAQRDTPHGVQTIEGMVAYEVRRRAWAEVLLYEDVYAVGRQIERAIFDELIVEHLFACAKVS